MYGNIAHLSDLTGAQGFSTSGMRQNSASVLVGMKNQSLRMSRSLVSGRKNVPSIAVITAITIGYHSP